MAGFASPNYTQTPNDFFDVLLAQITDLSELKVTLAVIRRTLGFHKKKDPISVRELQKLTGLSSQGTRDGIDKAIARGTVEIVGTGKRGIQIFGLVIDDCATEQHSQDDDRANQQHSSVLTSSTTKETTNKTRKKTLSPSGDEVSAESEKPKKARQPNPMYDVVLETWKLTAERNGLMQGLLTGTAKRNGWKEYNLETPVTPEQVREWAAWYKRANPGISVVSAPDKVQSSITYWQTMKEQAQAKQAEQGGDPAQDLHVAVEFDPAAQFQQVE